MIFGFPWLGKIGFRKRALSGCHLNLLVVSIHLKSWHDGMNENLNFFHPSIHPSIWWALACVLSGVEYDLKLHLTGTILFF